MDIKRYKLVKNTVLSIAILVFATWSVGEGTDPNLAYAGAVAIVALMNGIELGEFYAAWAEVRAGDDEE